MFQVAYAVYKLTRVHYEAINKFKAKGPNIKLSANLQNLQIIRKFFSISFQYSFNESLSQNCML